MVAAVIVHGKTIYQRINNDENKEITGNKYYAKSKEITQ